jgi:hypothetical protein
MIKMRVSEETPNLSHPSDLISTVRLENPSPSLMRSTWARGRTHSWVVGEILVRCQEALGEMPRAREISSSLVERAKILLVRCQEVLGEMPRTREVEAFLLREQEELKHSC